MFVFFISSLVVRPAHLTRSGKGDISGSNGATWSAARRPPGSLAFLAPGQRLCSGCCCRAC